MRPVAITAIGISCALGRDAHNVCQALKAHRSGARRVADLPASHVAEVNDVPELAGFPDDKKAALLADAASQLPSAPASVRSERRGVFLGTGLSSVTPRELAEDIYPHVKDGRVDRVAAMRDLNIHRVAPRRHLPERASAWLAQHVQATGPVHTTFSACAAGAEAIAAGARAIARGEADWVIAGGFDSMAHPLGMLSFDVLGALSPTQARPFDDRRDGFLLGEGAAVLLLQPLEEVTGPVLAVILGSGTSLDAHGITAPHPEGLGAENAMRRALLDAGLSPSQIDWVNTHGTATPLGDAAEAKAIARLLGPDVGVSSLKGAFGHTLAAAGAVEAVATVIAMNEGFTPGTVGCESPADLGINVLTHPLNHPPTRVLSNSFGFGGQNCTLVLAKAQEHER